MNLLQAAEEDRRGMTSVWLARLPSVREFTSGIDEPERLRDRPVSYLPGAYTQAASVLMEKMISLASEAAGSALIPPYLFLRRHHFEMQLKSILRTVANNPSRWREATGAAPGLFDDRAKKTHSLRDLWGRIQPMVEAVWANETHTWQLPRLTVTDVSELIRQLDDIDPKGDGVRYARHSDGQLTMLGVSRVDLEYTERNMLDITEFLWWARLEIGVTVINLPYEADEAEVRRVVTWQAGSDEEF